MTKKRFMGDLLEVSVKRQDVKLSDIARAGDFSLAIEEISNRKLFI